MTQLKFYSFQYRMTWIKISISIPLLWENESNQKAQKWLPEGSYISNQRYWTQVILLKWKFKRKFHSSWQFAFQKEMTLTRTWNLFWHLFILSLFTSFAFHSPPISHLNFILLGFISSYCSFLHSHLDFILLIFILHPFPTWASSYWASSISCSSCFTHKNEQDW